MAVHNLCLPLLSSPLLLHLYSFVSLILGQSLRAFWERHVAAQVLQTCRRLSNNCCCAKLHWVKRACGMLLHCWKVKKKKEIKKTLKEALSKNGVLWDRERGSHPRKKELLLLFFFFLAAPRSLSGDEWRRMKASMSIIFKQRTR